MLRNGGLSIYRRFQHIMTNKQTKKAKRPLQTTLGKAPGQNDKEEVDLSHVKLPIETSIYGLHQVINLLKTATEEVKDYITYECDIMYECRMCRTIFRSLANFILHKRNYCRIKYKTLNSNCGEDNVLGKVPPPEPPEEKRANQDGKGLLPVIEKLKEKQEIKQLTQELLNADLSNPQKNEEETIVVITNNDVLLEEIATNNAAVFQTVLKTIPPQDIPKAECMKNEVMELHGILESDKVALGADGKICSFQTNKLNAKSVLPKTELSCVECNIKFSTRKTLGFHLKNKHNNSRLVYVCPDCKETFTNAWSVYRHLYKVHRKTTAQVKRLREQVYNSVIRKDQEITNKKVEKKDASNLEKADEENQWLNNIEGDNDFQMCGGCGKRFERKAALQSHASMCIKRIAVCNTIKENNAKKREEESKDVKAKLHNKQEKSPTETQLKGASKRKPYLLRTYKQSSTNCDIDGSTKLEPSNTEITCDREVNGKNSDGNNKSVVDNCDNHKCNICDFNDNNDVKTTACDCSKQKKDSDKATVLEKKEECSKNKECFCSTSDGIGVDMLNILGVNPDDRIELIKEETIESSQSSDNKTCPNQNPTDFDLFCQRVAEHLKKIKSKEGGDDLAKFRMSPMSQKLLENGQDFQSPGKISIRSLEELRGFPKESDKDDEDMPILEPSVSPRTSKRNSRKLIKRKRTSSLDSERMRKTFRQSSFDVLLDKQDLNFMSRASPYMDRANLMCKTCRMKYPSISKLLWHMSAHFSWFRFQCSRCSFVSFGKSECASHARTNHKIKHTEITSVVLPIPNWKTLLMSSEFKELANEDELGGKLTDEVKSYCQTETAFPKNNEHDPSTNLLNTLFVDSESDTTDLSDLTDVRSFPMPITDEISSVKNEIIDITDDDQENFQLEVPQEIYTLDVFEVINIDGDSENRRSEIKEEDIEDEMIVPSVSVTPVPSEETTEGEDLTKSPSNSIVNIRPTRNRMRSIKTLQNDFFYDLGKVNNKQTESVAKTNGPQKIKKNNGSSNIKRPKEMRVYSKK